MLIIEYVRGGPPSINNRGYQCTASNSCILESDGHIYSFFSQGNYGLKLTARGNDSSELLCLQVDFQLVMPESSSIDSTAQIRLVEENQIKQTEQKIQRFQVA